MLDINFIRDNTDKVKEAAKNKGIEVNIDRILELDGQRRELRGKLDQLNRERNELAQAAKGGKPDEAAIEQGKKLKDEAWKIEKDLESIEHDQDALLSEVPNMPSDDTPIGKNDTKNKVIKMVGEKPTFDFEPKEHWELGKDLDILDTETASEVAGARFAYLKGDLVLLEFALIQYALATLTNEETLKAIIAEAGLSVPSTPFIPVVPPIFIREEVYQKMDRLEPREQRYHIDGTDQWLIGSAEHTMGPMHMNQSMDLSKLPLRYVGFSVALRQEAGTYGKDMKGMFRLHQFDKVEMESFSAPDQSREEHEFMIAIQEYLMHTLGIPYQLVLKCTGDMGKPNARAVDVEAWLPGQNKYRETHTADYMTDYQSRRLRIKLKDSEGKSGYVHMNDATAYAISRTPIAIIENYQTKDGTVRIPDVLKPFMMGIEEIKQKN